MISSSFSKHMDFANSFNPSAKRIVQQKYASYKCIFNSSSSFIKQVSHPAPPFCLCALLRALLYILFISSKYLTSFVSLYICLANIKLSTTAQGSVHNGLPNQFKFA